MLLAHVALPVPMAHLFTYEIPARLCRAGTPGYARALLVRAAALVGVVMASAPGEPPPKVKPLLDVLDDEPRAHRRTARILRDLSAYYLAPIER